MKRITFLSLISVLALATACQAEISINPDSTPVRQMTVYAGEAGTRTAVQVDGLTYHVNWSAGDCIAVAEIIEANFGFDPKSRPDPYQQAYSDPLAADAATASFNVTLEDRSFPAANPYSDSFRYVGVYPSGSLYSVHWTRDERAEWEEHWGDTTTPDHSTLLVELPVYQVPRADSFDPNADLMVSEVVESDTQPDELSLRFARVGTIAKITLKGLPAGMNVENGSFTFPDTWPGAYVVEYDPTLGKTGFFSKPSGRIDFSPEGVTVDGSGNAVLWLRTLSGTLSGWFKFDVTLSDGKGGKGGDPERYEKRVDLDALGRTINFPESGVTTFSVTLEKHYDLTFENESSEVTETSIEAHLRFDLGGKPHSTVSYGLIAFDPATPDPFESVRLETAAPGDIIPLIPDGDGRVTYLATELTPNMEYCFMPYMVIDDVTYYPEYSYFSYTTLVHYAYAEPELVDLGLPSGTKWATFNLGSDDPLTAGYYYAWGEVRPTEYFSNSYCSKYWYQAAYNTRGYARKYSTVTASGQDGLIDMKTVLDPEDDAATVCLGGEWRTPTADDFGEMMGNCTRSNVDGGYKYTSNFNGKSIIFPACGYYTGSTKNVSRTFMMTSSLYVDQAIMPNQAICSDVHSGMSEYSDGTTRGHMKFNVRPVKGGVRSGYNWTAHTSVTNLGGGSATVHGEFLEAEDLATYQDYTYTTHLSSDPTYYPGQSISRNGSHTYTGLTPGTTYYYYVTWDCRHQVGVDWYHHGGASEVRSFVAE